jgi:RecG-like helicase
VFCETQDGYALAESDMISRGAGDLDGLQQKGRATTTFKGVKMTVRDLLFNEVARDVLDMRVSTKQVDAESNLTKEPAEYEPVRKQASLFA